MNETSENITTEQKAPETKSAPAPSTGGTQKPGSKLWIVGLIIGIAVVIAAALVFDVVSLPGSEDADAGVQVAPETVVATVNGTEITRAELDKKMTELAAAFPAGVADPAFEAQVLDEVINLRLLLGEAESQGITVTEDEIDAEIASLVEAMGGEEVLAQELERNGITKEDLRVNMRQELVIRALLDANTDMAGVTVSEEEVIAVYEEAVASAPEGQELPPLTEVSELARAQIIQSKSADIVSTYLVELRAKADIEITL
jgi:parvulin-like peptidyl-prolyl isomerase